MPIENPFRQLRDLRERQRTQPVNGIPPWLQQAFPSTVDAVVGPDATRRAQENAGSPGRQIGSVIGNMFRYPAAIASDVVSPVLELDNAARNQIFQGIDEVAAGVFGTPRTPAAAPAGPQSTATQPFSPATQQGQAPAIAFRGMDGETITSTYRDPEHNTKVGGVANSYHTRRDANGNPMARDSVPPEGMSMSDYHRQLVALNPDMDVINEGDHIHMEPKAGYTGTGTVAGAVPTPQNPFEMAQPYFQQGMNELGRAEQAAMQPFSLDIPMPDAPAMPGPPTLPERDFSAQDQALEAMRPVMDTAKEQHATVRRSLFMGAAQALSAMPEGAGVGSILAKVGAGLLGGRMAGEQEVQDRIDRFDEKMAQWQVLNYQNESAKAAVVQEDLKQEAVAAHQHAMTGWANEMQQFNQNYNVQAQGNHLVVTSKTDTGRRVDYVPVTPAIRAGHATQRADAMFGIAGAAMQGAGVEASFNNSIALETWTREMRNGQQDQVATIVQSAPFLATSVVLGGALPHIVGDEAFEAAANRARERATAQAEPRSEEWQRLVEDMMIIDLSEDLINNPALRQRIVEYGPLTETLRQSRRVYDSTRTTTMNQSASGVRVTDRVQQ